jgi:hypothetical protein
MKLIILKIEANHHEEYIATRSEPRDISQNRNQSAREVSQERRSKRLLSKEVILQRKHFSKRRI